jgi:6-phosphogluconate dehydrogenase (decarboxylating)
MQLGMIGLGRMFAAKLLSAMSFQFGGHLEKAAGAK